MKAFKKVVSKYNSVSLIFRIFIGICIGVILALTVPKASWIATFGSLFVGALKAIAPILVAVLVTSALCQGSARLDKRFGMVIFLYLITTLIASFVAVVASFIFPQTMVLAESAGEQTPPGGVGEVLSNLLMNIIVNPVQAVSSANYMGILLWAVVFGLALKKVGSDTTKNMLSDFSDAVSTGVKWIINLAPFGICGLVFDSVSSNGLNIFVDYGKIVALLVGSMLVVSLIINPIIVAICLRCNPYPLVWRCLKESGITAFFTRSSAANIPVNMELCEKLGLDKDVYSVSIPLGAQCRYSDSSYNVIPGSSCSLWSIGRSRRITPSYTYGMFTVRYIQ